MKHINKSYEINMKKIILTIILIFSLQSWIKADIRELEVEGMSIGDSLLTYFSEQEIIDNKQKNQYPNDLFIVRNFYRHESFEIYDVITAIHLKKDKKYIIESIGALIQLDLNQCLEKKTQIESEFDQLFQNAPKETQKVTKQYDKSGESFAYITEYYLDKGEVIQVVCNDWSDKLRAKNLLDSLAVNLQSEKFRNFLLNDAYK
tara:strand:- start:15 stop:626 length:612 start_codon:yes stop_codon:yes gene_type:complete